MRILLDTHVLIWLAQGDVQLGPGARITIDSALESGSVLVSAVTFWEAALLAKRKRITLPGSSEAWRKAVLSTGMLEIVLDGAIAIRSIGLSDFHADPADRFLAATAMAHKATLLTADRKILDWPGSLARQDARL